MPSTLRRVATQLQTPYLFRLVGPKKLRILLRGTLLPPMALACSGFRRFGGLLFHRFLGSPKWILSLYDAVEHGASLLEEFLHRNFFRIHFLKENLLCLVVLVFYARLALE